MMHASSLDLHALDGATIQEKRRSFNSFLKCLEASITDSSELSNFISSITPTNPTEELFKLEIVIQFRQFHLLKNELKTNSPLLARKLLKNWKIFAEFISSIDVQIFINDILPYVSHSLKSKLLSGICKYVKDETLLDEYFLALEQKYGLKTAVILVPGCTINLIRTKISLFASKLTNRQLRNIFKKDHQFVEYYFDILQTKYANFDFTRNYCQTLMFIAKVDAYLYWKLSEKYNIHLTFGKRMTAKMIQANDEIFSDALKYIYDFKIRQLYNTIRKDGNLKKFILNIFPEACEEFPDIYQNRMLSFFFDIIHKYELYSTMTSVFKEKYEKNLLDYPQYCKEDFIKTVPAEEREKVLNILVKDDEKLVYLYQTSKSIPILRNRLQHSSDANTRSQLIILMYKTCAANKDKEALLETLHFILNRYKNDINVITTFFNHVVGWPNLIMLEEKYWKCIVDMAKIIEMTKETFYHDHFHMSYICHILERNAPCQEQCKDFIKYLFKHSCGRFYMATDKKYERKYIEQMGECIPMFKEQEYYQNMCITFLNCVADYNTRSRTSQIPFNNYDYMFNQIKAEKNCNAEIVIKFGLKHCQEDFWHNLFWNYPENSIIDCATLCWYLKNLPEKITENVNKVVDNLDKYRMMVFLRQARKILDIDTSEKIKMHALNNLHSQDRNTIKHSFKIISILKPECLSESVLSLLTTPDIETNLRKKEDRVLCKILIQKLHKLGEPLYIFPLVPKFCTAHYFKCCLSPLQSLASRTPELHVKRHLMHFSDKVVSIKKQILILAKDILTSEEYIKLLEEYSEIETHASIKNIIFKKTLQHFIDNPVDSVWMLTQTNLKLIDKEDRDIYNVLLKIEMIPAQYLPRYIEIVFDEISNNDENEIRKKRFKLLDFIQSQVIDNLDTEFLMRVVEDTACLKDISNFHWKCVLETDGEKQKQLFEQNFETLKHFIKLNGINSYKDLKVRSVISNFLNRFLSITLELKKGGYLVEKFIASWTSILQPVLFCKDYTTLLFTDLYFKSNFEALQTGIRIYELLCNYIENYSISIIPLFSKFLTQFLDKVSIWEREDLMKFIEGFTNNEYNENIYIVVMYLLRRTSKMKSSSYYKDISILKDIQKCANPIVKLHYDVYLANN